MMNIVFFMLMCSLSMINGQCTEVQNMKDFNLTSFGTGRWYVFQSFRLYGDLKASCAYGTFKESWKKATLNFFLGSSQSQTVDVSKTTTGLSGQVNFNIMNMNIPIKLNVSKVLLF